MHPDDALEAVEVLLSLLFKTIADHPLWKRLVQAQTALFRAAIAGLGVPDIWDLIVKAGRSAAAVRPFLQDYCGFEEVIFALVSFLFERMLNPAVPDTSWIRDRSAHGNT